MFRPCELDGEDGSDVGNGLDFENMHRDSERHSPHRAPSATVLPFGRGPSQAADFFSAGGAPSVLEVNFPSVGAIFWTKHLASTLLLVLVLQHTFRISVAQLVQY